MPFCGDELRGDAYELTSPWHGRCSRRRGDGRDGDARRRRALRAMSGRSGWQRTLCPYCGVGCGLLVRVDDGAVVRAKGDPDHPANWGDICAKAVHLPPVLRTPGRLLHPHVRARRDGDLERVPWEMALRVAAERVREIVERHGPDAMAVYASGQLLTEEYYVASKLCKGFIGTNNFD